ncbi:unnamed protein product [Phyllotreta striolata]|uniref:Uncharacterized protein n=1 Tax=Phyllotreta striolata TaxID=444603 RepID=A0A9N9TU75_PHYSR|nr:unnamed protein product [Phyllotreta striolata]
MKTVLVLLSLIVAYASSTFVGKHVVVNEDETILVIGEHGRQIRVNKHGPNPKMVEIILKTPYSYSKKILIDGARFAPKFKPQLLDPKLLKLITFDNKPVCQHNFLSHVFRQYEGLLEQGQYDRLMKDVDNLVLAGAIQEPIRTILKTFDEKLPQLIQQHWIYQFEEYVPREDEFGLTPLEEKIQPHVHTKQQQTDETYPPMLLAGNV